MQCGEFEARLNETLDHRERPEEDRELGDHAAGCAACAQTLDDHRQLLAVFQTPVAWDAPEDFSSRVLHRVAAKRTAWYHRPVWLALALSTAAAVMLAVLPLLSRSPDVARREAPSRPRLRTGVTAIAQTQPRTPHQAAFASEATELQLLFRELMQSWGDGRLQVRVDPLASSIRPLAVTFNVAFDAIRRTLPGVRTEAPVDPQASFPFDCDKSRRIG